MNLLSFLYRDLIWPEFVLFMVLCRVAQKQKNGAVSRQKKKAIGSALPRGPVERVRQDSGHGFDRNSDDLTRTITTLLQTT